MVAELILSNFEFIEIQINADTVTSSVNFPRQAQLSGMRISGIEVYTANDFPNSFINYGYALPTLAQVQAGALFLYNSQRTAPPDTPVSALPFKTGINKIPLVALHRIQNSEGDPFVRQLMAMDNPVIQWEKSGIFFSSAQTFSTNTSFVFGEYYSSAQQSIT